MLTTAIVRPLLFNNNYLILAHLRQLVTLIYINLFEKMSAIAATTTTIDITRNHS